MPVTFQYVLTKTQPGIFFVSGRFVDINMSFVRFTTSPNMSSHLDGMPTVEYWGKMQLPLLQTSICT